MTIYGGDAYWIGDTTYTLDPIEVKPVMRKFLVDGMLYIGEIEDNKSASSWNFVVDLVNGIYDLQQHFNAVNQYLYDEIPIGDLPNNFKIGIAQGTLYKLLENDGTYDYIGPCINLASRLIKYCADINFILSARLSFPKNELEKYGYYKVIATKLRSFEMK